MKKLNYFFALLTILSFSFIVACSSDESDTDESDSTIVQMEEKMDKIESGETDTLSSPGTDENAKLGKEYTAKYVCPMHCKGSGSDKPGECSECGMDLIENQNYKSN